MTLAELLVPFKAEDDPTRIVCLVDDLEAMRVVAVWPNVPMTWKKAKGAQPEERNELWAWLWEGCDVYEPQVAEMAGVGERAVAAKITMLASARLIFPDGTVSNLARGLIQRRVSRELFDRPKPRPATRGRR